ncbi:Thioesterase superfamily protein [Poriferisphaera corsica]|uniref:Thioesterase superfamily protein n=1 Tax=Poriferisphaera corsica TaxID=2528020 RepID=A0A517YPC8_9BACT|nr:thioesterase family protein [Poriferisphaera corsica]QDU32077.1 Thioesterase superfamily protein [Poriferisphaera corsica]
MAIIHTTQTRVRYGETDQMNTFYNAVALDWFEVGRNEALRSTGRPYTQWETDGIFLPVIEARIFYKGRANYDDLLDITATLTLEGRARLRAAVTITRPDHDGASVAEGYTIHALANPAGRPVRPPQWVTDLFTN